MSTGKAEWRPYTKKEKHFIRYNIDRYNVKQIALKIDRSERGVQTFIEREQIIPLRVMTVSLNKLEMLQATLEFIQSLKKGSPFYDIAYNQLKILSEIKISKS